MGAFLKTHKYYNPIFRKSKVFYKLKNFETFIKLIEDGIIEITFKIGTHKNGSKKGKPYDHGTDFSINIKDIDKLFDSVSLSD